jgi:hypothetical protein
MTIAEALLPKLSEWGPAGAGRHSWSHNLSETGWALHLTADRVDTLGCLLWDLTLTRAGGGAVTNNELKRRATAAAERVTGLMEPLRFLELDETRGEALLRSESPTKRSGTLAFYEVLMSGGRQVTVRRYKAAEHGRREQTAFALTHEAIAKLVDDLVRE